MLKNKKFFLGIIVGILFSGVGVYAATTYLASDITYKDTTVEAALNDLYDRNKYCVSGTIDHAANTQWNIDIGFIPTTFHISYQISTGGYRHFGYNKNLNKKVYLAADNLTDMYIQEWATYFDVSSTVIKTTLPNDWAAYSEEYTLYYTACK